MKSEWGIYRPKYKVPCGQPQLSTSKRTALAGLVRTLRIRMTGHDVEVI